MNIATRNNSLQKILVIQTAFIGDVILATSLLEKLHHHFPTAQIDILLRRGNESLLTGHPFVTNVLIWNKKNKYKSLWHLIIEVQNHRYDKVICLQRFGSMGLLTALSGATERIGFNKNPFAWLFTKRVQHQIGKTHEIERNTALISWFTDSIVFKPKLYVLPKMELISNKPYICMAPTSVWFTKQFPESKWVALIQTIPKQYHIYLLGAPSDIAACERILLATSRQMIENLAGKLSLLQSAALMQGAVLNFVNDSAPMHLASAVNAPTCAIFCSTIPDFGFGPLADFSKIVEVKQLLACRPCGLHGKRTCPEGHFRCGYDVNNNDLLATLSAAEAYYQRSKSRDSD